MKIRNNNNTFNFSEYIHYTLGIEKENYENEEEKKIQKKYYNAFLSINNITTENKTDIVTNLYLTNINQLNIIYLSINYLKNILTIPH